MDRRRHRGEALVVESVAVHNGHGKPKGRGLQEAALSLDGVVDEALSQRQGEKRQEETVHDHVPAGGLPGIHRLEIPLQRAVTQGAEAAELGPSRMAAGRRERGIPELGAELAIKREEFMDIAPGSMLVRGPDGRQFDGAKQPFAVAGEKGADCRKGLRSGGLDEIGEGGKRGDGLRRTQGAGERREIPCERFARFGREFVWNRFHRSVGCRVGARPGGA